MFNLFLMNLILCTTSYLIVKYFLYFEKISDLFIALFLIFLSQIILTLQLLGIFNALYLENVILLNLCILLIIYIIIKIAKIKIKNHLYIKLKSLIINLKFSKIEILFLSVILGFGLIKVFINLINPPFGWDDLNYHFTFPVEWLKHHNLENPIVVSCDPSPTYYPINGSLFFLWFILPLKNVFVADLGQVPFFIAAFLAVYSLGRKLNLSKEYALFSASIFTLVPNYFKQLKIAYVDIMVAALFLMALNYLFLLSKNDKNGLIKNTILYSISLGLMLGTKTTALPYAFLLFIPFLYFCFAKLKFKKSLTLISVCILFIVITGGFTYIRNFIQTNNPLYPLNLKLFNKIIFKGVMDTQIYRAHVLPEDYNLTKILFSEGLGGQTLIFLLPAIFLGLPFAIIKRRKDLSFNLIYFMILPYFLILSYRFIMPMPNLRYLYPLFGIGFIIAFYVLEALNFPKSILKTLIIMCVLGSIAELAKGAELVISLALSITIFLVFPYLLKLIRKRAVLKYAVFIVIILFLLLFFLEKDYVSNEYVRYIKMAKYSGFWPDATRAWAWLNKNTTANNIAYIGRPVPFPLYGMDFKNNVYYVSVNKIEPARLYKFIDSKYVWSYEGESVHKSFEEERNYRGRADYSSWLNNLFKRNTDYLFVYSLHQTKTIQFPIEDEWANKHPEIFDLVFKNDIIHIYKIKK